MLKPGLRVVWRDPSTLQLGVDLPHPVVLRPVADQVAEWLRSLDGHDTWERSLTRAADAGLEVTEALGLLRRLADAGLLADAATPQPPLSQLPLARRTLLAAEAAAAALPDPRPDASARALHARLQLAVTVADTDRLGLLVAHRLEAAGVGGIDVVPDVLAAIGRPRTRDRQPIVLVPTAQARGSARELVRATTPHLVTESGETLVRIGPLVSPGDSACQGCLDQHRTDRDPSWPALAAQLDGRGAHPTSESLLALAASLAALHLLHWSDHGTAPEVDGVVEVSLPLGSVTRRTCPPHPACGCAWPGAATQVASAG